MNVTCTIEGAQVVYYARGGQIDHLVPDSLPAVILVYISINDTSSITILCYSTQENLRLALPQVPLIATEQQ